jgi:hypothetical protein
MPLENSMASHSIRSPGTRSSAYGFHRLHANRSWSKLTKSRRRNRRTSSTRSGQPASEVSCFATLSSLWFNPR